MSARRPRNWTRTLVALWTLLWMGLAAPCAMAGQMAGAAGQGNHLAAGGSPTGDDTPAALLCLHDCNQQAVGQDLQPVPSPDTGLERPAPMAAESGSTEPAVIILDPDAPPPRRATYLLNATFLI